MKKPFKERLIGKLLIGGLKLADKGLTGGILGKLTECEVYPKGKINASQFVDIISTTIPIMLLVALLAGWIDLDTLKDLIKVFN